MLITPPSLEECYGYDQSESADKPIVDSQLVQP